MQERQLANYLRLMMSLCANLQGQGFEVVEKYIETQRRDDEI